jgi:hypothetical protein
MAVLPQARRGLARELLGVEQESDQLVRREAPQFIARLDVMQRAAVGGQIDCLSVFFSALATVGMEALRSS